MDGRFARIATFGSILRRPPQSGSCHQSGNEWAFHRNTPSGCSVEWTEWRLSRLAAERGRAKHRPLALCPGRCCADCRLAVVPKLPTNPKQRVDGEAAASVVIKLAVSSAAVIMRSNPSSTTAGGAACGGEVSAAGASAFAAHGLRLDLRPASAAPSYLGMNLWALWIDLGRSGCSHIADMRSLPLFALHLEPPPVIIPSATLITASVFGAMLWGVLIAGTWLAWPASYGAGYPHSVQSVTPQNNRPLN